MDDKDTISSTVSSHLNDLRNFPKYILTEKDKRTISYDKAQWITDKLTLKKFRKAKVSDETLKDIKSKAAISIKEDKPVYLILLFGGYKHFWNSSYPEVDFAELFNLRFMGDYVAPILEAHRPGVILDYESEDVIMWMDNYPEEALDSYAESFKKLLGTYSKGMPNNFRINYVRAREQYDPKRLYARIEELAPKRREEWNKLSKEELEAKLHRSPTNIMWDGRENWTKLDESARREKIFESKIINETFYDADFELRGDYLAGGNHIPLVLSWGLTYENTLKWLTLGSTYASSTDFWTGRGLIEYREGKCIERIVSHKQYETIKGGLRPIKVDYLPVKNFEYIEVYDGELNFGADS